MVGHVSERRLDEAVRRVAQEVPKHAGLSDGNSFGGEADLGGVWGLVVGGVQVEVCDVPEPGWRHGGGVNTRVHVVKDCVERGQRNCTLSFALTSLLTVCLVEKKEAILTIGILLSFPDLIICSTIASTVRFNLFVEYSV